MDIVKSNDVILKLLWVMVFFAVIFLSCISQPVFAENYQKFLSFWSMPDAWRHYLLRHYKLGHPLFYALLAATTAITFRRYFLSLCLCFSLGVLLELVQLFLPTRSASGIDLLYNLAGIVVGLVIVKLLSVAGMLLGRERS